MIFFYIFFKLNNISIITEIQEYSPFSNSAGSHKIWIYNYGEIARLDKIESIWAG